MSTPEPPGWIALGDVNDDGFDDIIMTHESQFAANDITVLLSDGAGGFLDVPVSEQITLTLTDDYLDIEGPGEGPSSPRDVVVFDIDEDGDRDIVTVILPDDVLQSDFDPDVDAGLLVTFPNVMFDDLVSPPTLFAPAGELALGFSASECFLPAFLPPMQPLAGLEFRWSHSLITAPLVPRYTLQIARDAQFQNIELEFADLTFLPEDEDDPTPPAEHFVPFSQLKEFTFSTTHYWRVLVENGAGASAISMTHVFTNPNRADFNSDGKVDGADLATLLSVWDTDGGTTCTDVNEDGVVNGADMAFLLANWTPESSSAMAMQDDFAFDEAFLFDEDASVASAHAATAPTPWIVSHFGFSAVDDYVNWLDGLSDEALTAHILDLLHLLLGE